MSIKAPTRDIGRETQETLETQVRLAPEVYAAEAKYSPLYSALNVQNYRDSLTGTNGQPGLLDLYEKEIAPAMQRGQAASAAGDVNTLEELGPRAVRAMKMANPEQAALLGELNKQAMEELSMGAHMDPSLAREVTQGIRGGQAARGFGTGHGDVTEEVIGRALQAERLRANRRAFAGQVVGYNQATSIDPAMVVLGRPAQGGNLIGQGAGGAQQAAAGVNFDPMQNPYAQDYWNTVYNARSAAKIAGNNANAAIWGSVIESAGNLAGAAAAGCWVARAVYGEASPTWKQFRRWLMNYGPAWFRALYIKFGPAVGEWIKDKPRVKAIVRRWMDARIKRMQTIELAESVKAWTNGEEVAHV